MFNFPQTIKQFAVILLLSGCMANRPSVEMPNMPTTIGDIPIHYDYFLILDSNVVSGPTVNDEYILIQTEKSLYKINTIGDEIWKGEYPGHLGMFSPTICGDLVVVPVAETSGFIVIFNGNGSVVWKAINSESIYTKGGNIEDVLCSGNYVYVAKYNAGIFVYDIQSGELAWTHELPERSSIYLATNSSKEEIYVAVNEYLIAFDMLTGKLIWKLAFNTYIGPIAYESDKLILLLGVANKKDVAVVDLSSRSILWRKELLNNFTGNSQGGIITDKNTIYLTGNRVIALSMSNGDTLWESQETESLRRPVLFNNSIYVRNNGNFVYVLDMNTGGIIGKLIIGKESEANSFDRSPTVFNEQLFVPFGDNRVFVYKP